MWSLVYSAKESLTDLLFSENEEVSIAAIEFIVNLSADRVMQNKIESSKLFFDIWIDSPNYTKLFIQRYYYIFTF